MQQTQAIQTVKKICLEKKLKLTPLRKTVLEIIWQSQKPMSAYQILHQLNSCYKSSAPPTVYRTLEFLMQQAFIHRLASLNAFIPCQFTGAIHVSQFYICNRCGGATEMPNQEIHHLVCQKAHNSGFQPQKQVLEIFGVCSQCQLSIPA